MNHIEKGVDNAILYFDLLCEFTTLEDELGFGSSSSSEGFAFRLLMGHKDSV